MSPTARAVAETRLENTQLQRNATLGAILGLVACAALGISAATGHGPVSITAWAVGVTVSIGTCALLIVIGTILPRG